MNRLKLIYLLSKLDCEEVVIVTPDDMFLEINNAVECSCGNEVFLTTSEMEI